MAKSRFYDTASIRKRAGAWKHDISFESGVDSGGNEAGARKQCAVLLWDRGPEARPFHFNNNFMLILSKNYDENTRGADRDPHGILCSPMDADRSTDADRTPRQTTGFVDRLAAGA